MAVANKTKATVLIADDSPTIRLFLGNILEQADYRLLVAEDGIAAIEKAFEHLPDLIISDIEMPNMDGYQVCRLLKNDPHTSGIPIIILTSLESAGSVFWGYQTGADLYLLKNFQPQELLAAIEKLLSGREKSQTGKKGIKIDAPQIMAKLNQFLDQQLFATTLVNEINRISISLTTLSETVKDLLGIIEKVMEAYLSGLVLISDNRSISLGVRENRRVREQVLEQFQFTMLEDLANLLNEDISDFEISAELMESPAELNDGNDIIQLDPNHLYAVPLRSRETTFGALCVYHPQMARISSSQKQLLEKISPHISTALSTILMYSKIKNLSVIDGLTQLYNRRQLMDLFKTEFAKSERYKSDLSLIMLDIDNFKKVNDTHGHLSGDLVLKKLSSIIRQVIRNIDIPGRYGGEEFMIVLPSTPMDKAVLVAERIRGQVETGDFRTMSGETLPVTVSIGVSSAEELENRSNELELIKMADTRLYIAKRGGKNQVVGRQ